MDKTILVIGEVTRNAYDPIRLDVLRRGDQPHIKRLNGFYEFLMPEVELLEKYQGIYDTSNMTDFDVEMCAGAAMHKHLEQFGCIVAIIMDEASWVLWESSYHTEVFEQYRQGHDYPYERYVVRSNAVAELVS